MRERFIRARKAIGLKQREVAERLGIKVGVVGGWECGKNRIPDARLYQFCNEFNVNRTWLETGEGEMFTKERLEPQNPDAIVITKQELLEGFAKLSPETQRMILNALYEVYKPETGVHRAKKATQTLAQTPQENQ
ncbi:MAG: helix-turn-helix transcriptional regulator [Planctomycetia bacterium]|nr:helix-turn-helix transcriptional regulator [Planctomycetia bacterium]